MRAVGKRIVERKGNLRRKAQSYAFADFSPNEAQGAFESLQGIFQSLIFSHDAHKNLLEGLQSSPLSSQ